MENANELVEVTMENISELRAKCVVRERQVDNLSQVARVAKEATEAATASLARRFGFDVDAAIQHLRVEGLWHTSAHLIDEKPAQADGPTAEVDTHEDTTRV